MKQSLLFILLVSGLFPVLFAQNVAVKTNGLYWLTMTPNAGIEFALNKKVTLDLSAAYNPWTFKADKKMRFWFVQPEAKYWFCEKFEGHFVGLHLHGAQYFGGFKEKRYDGYLLGGGLTYGYDWILSPHWNLEASIGIGYAHLWYKESDRIPCLKCYENKHKNYVGPTKATLSLIYIF
ncbi:MULTISPECIES: DUF3575 domain-containing protein [Bacteroides]|uniref:DUF3575 domain-containing protein n=1 Tax=Bacteroides TaxID=816 RepID=UPI0001BC8736|nr:MULTISPECIES: DUF3575 domain-containing protein [Bacteroides]EFS34404.1 hypothetical protein BSGG_5104 [Bacteroides sp. D2]MDC2625479.1 DUF3575 domain-containing protein [Bacteroides ovatus]MDC2639368.1 DUF3575 domain-containing protein [Bacteroides ovatus]MDC2653698.1 DUF3575 domain-containing protein [Bacteroides ovatus]UWO01400.1 DUF3575 domain-containing protein [Bacteroides sp. D2]